MTEKERIKNIRDSLGLSQEEFARQIGIGRSALSQIETGRTNPSEQTLMLVCDKFHVNEDWLRHGEGEMFLSPESQHLENIYQRYNLTPEDRIIVEEFLALSPEVRRGILDYVVRVADRLRQQEDIQIEREATEIARQLREEKERADGSFASQDTASDTKMA